MGHTTNCQESWNLILMNNPPPPKRSKTVFGVNWLGLIMLQKYNPAVNKQSWELVLSSKIIFFFFFYISHIQVKNQYWISVSAPSKNHKLWQAFWFTSMFFSKLTFHISSWQSSLFYFCGLSDCFSSFDLFFLPTGRIWSKMMWLISCQAVIDER